MEAEKLKEQKKALYRSINGGISRVTELQYLIKYASKTDRIERFDEGIFEQFIDRIIAFSPTEIGFELKCGITLKERMER